MNNSVQWQSLGCYGANALVGITHSEGNDGHNQARQMQHLGNLLGIVGCGSNVATSQTLHLGYGIELLCKDGDIENSTHERLQVVKPWLGIALLTPFHKSVEIGTESEHNGRLGHHRLIEMTRHEPLFHFFVFSNNDTIELHAASSGCMGCCLEHIVKQFIINYLG